MKYSVLLFLSMISYTHLWAISIVYNFRIAQITKQPITEKSTDQNHTMIGLILDQHQEKYNGVHQTFLGGLSSYIYDFSPYYFRTDFAVSHIQETAQHITTFSGTETDDILFTVGRNFIPSNKTVMTLSGLFGVPTHNILRLQHVDFGYSQVSAGIQYDGSYALHENDAFVYGARYIRFIPRTARDDTHKNYTFTIGNIADVLFAYKNSWHKHGLEGGYTARSQFGAHISPKLDDTAQKSNYLRSSFYCVYKYKFLLNNLANRFLFNISYGFDHRPKVFGNKYIATLWASWNIRF